MTDNQKRLFLVHPVLSMMAVLYIILEKEISGRKINDIYFMLLTEKESWLLIEAENMRHLSDEVFIAVSVKSAQHILLHKISDFLDKK